MFPMYRGALLLVIYLWLLPWNVYIWAQCHINYKLIFKFNHHFSKYEEILKRSASFTTFFFISFILFMQSLHSIESQIEPGTKHNYFDESFREKYPLIFWGFFFLYLFFPSTKVFNGQGRRYMFRIFKKILFFSFFHVDFVIVWATDQLASFVILIQDLNYTICFYVNNIFLDNSYKESFETCSSSGLQLEAFLLSCLPLFLRMIQCTTSNFKKSNGFSIRNSDFFNFLKYLFSFVTALTGYIYYLDCTSPVRLILWLCLAILSTIYSYIWDLEQDWGFLAQNTEHRFLRSQLSYPKISWYYSAITLNFILRLSWTISLSTVAFEVTERKEIIMLVVGLLEMLRRAIWNFFRVEKEHIINCGIFKAVEEYELPFDDLKKDRNFREEEYMKMPETTSSSFKPLELDNDDLTASLMRNENFNVNYHMHSIENRMSIDFKRMKHVNSNSSMNNRSKIFQTDEKLDTLKDLIEEISQFEKKLREKLEVVLIESEKSGVSVVTFQNDKNHLFERELSLEKPPLNLYEKSISINYFRQIAGQESFMHSNEDKKIQVF